MALGSSQILSSKFQTALVGDTGMIILVLQMGERKAPTALTKGFELSVLVFLVWSGLGGFFLADLRSVTRIPESCNKACPETF